MKEKNRLFSRVWDSPYGRTNPFHLFDAAKNSKEFVQKLQLQVKIPVHNGCVNSICWNDNGKYLLSGSDDQRLSVVHGYDYSVLAYVHTGHRANIFSAKFLPSTGDSNVVSCSGDGIIIYSNLERPETSMNNKFNCHKGTAYEIMTVPNDSNTFLSCGEDRTVRWFDIRTKTSCSKEECKDDILINCRSPVTSLAVNPLTPYQLAVGCADASVRIFDRRMLSTQAAGSCSSNGFQALMTCFTVPEFTQSRRITSLCYSADGQEMLVSYSSDYIYLFDIRDDLDKKPRLLSRDSSSSGTDNESGLFFRGKPLMKRLRVRGDWSDTGPNARPEAEARVEPQETSSQTNIVRRMTDILTRMFNSSAQNRTRSVATQSSSGSSGTSSQSEDGTADRASDSNEEEGEENAVPERVPKMQIQANESKEASPSNRDAKLDDNKDAKLEDDKKVDNRTLSDLPSTSYSAFELTKTAAHSSSQYEPSTSKTESCNETENVLPDVHEDIKTTDTKQMLSESVNLSFENIRQKLESRRKDLIEKHHSEPMVNLVYSGQSVDSGLITMDVANSSAANERQWLEQSASDLPELPPSVCSQQQPSEIPLHTISTRSERASSESDTEAAVQTIEPCDNLFPVMSEVPTDAQSDRGSSESETEFATQTVEPHRNFFPVISEVRSLVHSSSSSAVAEAPEAEEGDVDIMMEVDSWDMDSDDDVRPANNSRSAESARRSSCDLIPEGFLSSIEDEVKVRNEELKREESHMASVTQPKVKQKYTGHRNARTMIKESTFWGDNFIMSGSDCGHIFIWNRHTAELVMLMEADHHVVNCLQPHPFDPILASSGIDYDIKLWAPLREEPFFNLEKATEIIKRNEIMLEETKDTITVPASFMFRMLATLNHFRTGRAYRWSRAAREMRSANSDSSTR